MPKRPKRKRHAPSSSPDIKQQATSAVETKIDPVTDNSVTVIRRRITKSEWEKEKQQKASKKSPKKKAKTSRIILESKRGRRFAGGTCSECDVYYDTRWRYTRSNHGEVYLCSYCKRRVLDRSFGKIDAMEVSVSGGGVETNRRRH